jgi:FlaA1/EpsC-like NDP-sugar epimerase
LITDLARSVSATAELKVVGLRPGEKIHEEMITGSDSFSTVDLGSYYAILPSDGRLQQAYQQSGVSFEPVDHGFAYNSGSNPEFLGVEELRELIRIHIDSSFSPT